MPYPHQEIEKKWQNYWDAHHTFEAENGSSKPKFYGLIEFPYPSGAGLHVGHPRSYTAMDILCRKRRMQGFNVLYPIGWDAFGLPTENYAIKTGRKPQDVTKENIATFKRQIKSLGLSFDWSREMNTTDPTYYKWTQWIFLQLFKHGLAYKKEMAINWCPRCKIGLANEEVVGGSCERCGETVEKRNRAQWMLAITKYADKLLEGLKDVDYIPQAKVQQEHWIGRSEGAEVDFKIEEGKGTIRVFTTRPDTLFGATYMVLAPEHPLVFQITMPDQRADVESYLASAHGKTEIERTAEGKEKTGVFTGAYAVNPATNERIPIWVADYVLATYGTGAIMAVPAHDERDFEFAKKYSLPIKQVIMPALLDVKNPPRPDKEDTKRDVVHVILRDSKNKEVLIEFLKGDKWGKEKPRNFIIGGIEQGETEIEAAIREIQEETGYEHVHFVEKIPLETQASFFAAHKNVNRVVHVYPLIFELVDHTQREITEEEKALHDLVWVDEDEVAQTVSIPDDQLAWDYVRRGGYAFVDDGVLVNSDFLNGLSVEQAKEKIIQWLEANGKGQRKVQYKLRDWVFSRQRYWGEPIPLVYCEHCAREGNPESKGEEMNPGWISLPESCLPLTLPDVEHYEPTDTGESPLSKIEDWVQTTCPRCGGSVKRETDTMPNWAGSSWYFLRYCDPHNEKEFASQESLNYWMPVDWYNGGMEHTVLHLLYSRFWNQFLFDIGCVPISEPYAKRTSHGMILAKGGEKMSKSKGNVVNPDEIVEQFGADTFRTYSMFMGPFDEAASWDPEGIVGVRRFLEKVWNLQEKVKEIPEDPALVRSLHQTMKRVDEHIDAFRFNTAVSQLMGFVNALSQADAVPKSIYEKLLLVLAPFAPHLAEELWGRFGKTSSISCAPWPAYDEALIKEETVEMAVQVNGKLRGTVMMVADADEEAAKEAAFAHENVKKFLEGKEIVKTIYVRGKLVNLVVR